MRQSEAELEAWARESGAFDTSELEGLGKDLRMLFRSPSELLGSSNKCRITSLRSHRVARRYRHRGR